MAPSSSSSFLPSRSPTTASHRRRAALSGHSGDDDSMNHPDPAIEQAPNPPRIFQILALCVIVGLGFLQLLPATHFRDRNDPSRSWVPFNSTSYSALSQSVVSGDGNANIMTTDGGGDGKLHVISWIDCLDLRMIAVLANSTLSSSRYPDLVYFHFFVPHGDEDKVSFYKLKVLFPHSNLEFHGQNEVKEIIRSASSGMELAESNFKELAPFAIPAILQLNKFIYVSPNVIMKGKVEELLGIDMGKYEVGTAEDCSRKLDTLVNSDLLDVVQRSASQPWISETPYMKNSCVPDMSLLLINKSKWEGDFLKAVIWWSKVLNERSRRTSAAIVLALYNKYLKLCTSWMGRAEDSSALSCENIFLNYDGPKTSCSLSDRDVAPGLNVGSIWTQHLPSQSDQVLGY